MAVCWDLYPLLCVSSVRLELKETRSRVLEQSLLKDASGAVSVW